MKEYREFIDTIKDLNANSQVQNMRNYRQHCSVSCYKHCLEVSYMTYKYCKKHNLDYVSGARGAFLHDMFLYDWRIHQNDLPVKGLHAFAHPKIALINANKYFKLNEKEKDIIAKHMWPVTLFHIPKFRESFVVTISDKLSTLHSLKKKKQ